MHWGKLQTGGGIEAKKEDGEKADGNEESPLYYERLCLQVAVIMEVMNKQRFGALSRPISWGCDVIGEEWEIQRNTGKNSLSWLKKPDSELHTSWCGQLHKETACLSTYHWICFPSKYHQHLFQSQSLSISNLYHFKLPQKNSLIFFCLNFLSHQNPPSLAAFVLLCVKGAVTFISGELFHLVFLKLLCALKGLCEFSPSL